MVIVQGGVILFHNKDIVLGIGRHHGRRVSSSTYNRVAETIGETPIATNAMHNIIEPCISNYRLFFHKIPSIIMRK